MMRYNTHWWAIVLLNFCRIVLSVGVRHIFQHVERQSRESVPSFCEDGAVVPIHSHEYFERKNVHCKGYFVLFVYLYDID